MIKEVEARLWKDGKLYEGTVVGEEKPDGTFEIIEERLKEVYDQQK